MSTRGKKRRRERKKKRRKKERGELGEEKEGVHPDTLDRQAVTCTAEIQHQDSDREDQRMANEHGSNGDKENEEASIWKKRVKDKHEKAEDDTKRQFVEQEAGDGQRNERHEKITMEMKEKNNNYYNINKIDSDEEGNDNKNNISGTRQSKEETMKYLVEAEHRELLNFVKIEDEYGEANIQEDSRKYHNAEDIVNLESEDTNKLAGKKGDETVVKNHRESEEGNVNESVSIKNEGVKENDKVKQHEKSVPEERDEGINKTEGDGEGVNEADPVMMQNETGKDDSRADAWETYKDDDVGNSAEAWIEGMMIVDDAHSIAEDSAVSICAVTEVESAALSTIDCHTSLHREYKDPLKERVLRPPSKHILVKEWIDKQSTTSCSATAVSKCHTASKTARSTSLPDMSTKLTAPTTRQKPQVLARDLENLETVLYMRRLVNHLLDKALVSTDTVDAVDALDSVTPDEELETRRMTTVFTEVERDNKPMPSPIMNDDINMTKDTSRDRDGQTLSGCRLEGTQRNSKDNDSINHHNAGWSIEEPSGACKSPYIQEEEDMDQYQGLVAVSCSPSLISQRSRLPVPVRNLASQSFGPHHYIASNTRGVPSEGQKPVVVKRRLEMISKLGSMSSISLGGYTNCTEAQQFHGTQLFRQRLKMAKQGNEAWQSGLTPLQIWLVKLKMARQGNEAWQDGLTSLQIWLVMQHASAGPDDKPPPWKAPRSADTRAKISCWRRSKN